MYSNDNDHYGYGHTGDPHLDKEYERNNYYNKMPENVKMFILNFRAAIKDGVMFEIQNLYENTFPQLSDQYYDKSSWPNEEEVLEILEIYDKDDKDDKDVFIILYKELYYRHIHARMPNNLDLSQRTNSFLNYCDFFNLLLSEEEPVVLELPDIWLWELIDEFVYQFQNFAQYRARLTDKTPSEMNQLSNGNNNWSILCILNVLHSLVDISNIKKQLEAMSAGIDPRTVAGKYGEHSFYKMLGYFSLIGLLRLHSLLGDYYQAIKVLEPIEIHKKSQYSHIPACQISMSYYIGFAYMMMRRYSDAIRTFSSILLYIQRTKQLYSSRSYQNDQINKQTDQMYQLLSICLVLHPQCIDESIQQVLREKNYHENMCRMQCGEVEAFENYFSYSCPKFVSPVPPPQDAPIDDYVKDPLQHQLKVFLDEVKQQLKLPTIRSYLKLYTTLPLEKLASFMKNQIRSDEEKQKEEEKKNEEQTILKPAPELPLEELLLIHLLCFKHKMKNIVWTKGSSGLEGKFQSGSELDFYIDNDMIHIADTKVSHRYGDFFIRKIIKFEDLNHRLHSIHIK